MWILLVTSLAVGVAAPTVQTTLAAPAAAALDECAVLVKMEVYSKAIERCEQAVLLDATSPDPYFMLGRAYFALLQQDGATTPDEVKRAHRRKAAENFKKFLALNRGDTESRRQVTSVALSAVLAIYLFEDEKDDAALEYANRLAEQPSLERDELLMLVKVYSRLARPELSEKFLTRHLAADPSDAEVCQDLAMLYNEPVWKGSTRFDDSVGTFERCAALTPSDAAVYFRLATFLWDKAYRDKGLAGPQKLAYVERGIAHIDRALALKKDLWEALVYKSLLLRVKAMAVSDPARREQLMTEAAALQRRAADLKTAGVPPYPGLYDGLPPPPAPLPPPTLPPGLAGDLPLPPPPPSGAVRVGGQIPQPKKLNDVPPEYPDVAQKARVGGVVILEVTISPEGTVVDAKVLRSIPLLDAAAVAAVRQWIYTPTLLNGVPVAVIMTVTVNFKLS